MMMARAREFIFRPTRHDLMLQRTCRLHSPPMPAFFTLMRSVVVLRVKDISAAILVQGACPTGHSACWADRLMALASLGSTPGLEVGFSA